MNDFLLISLDVAVPVAIEEVRSWTPDQRLAYCHEHADTIASRSDDLMYGSKRKGEVAKLFGILARALACLAYQPGGVRDFCGRRWNANPTTPDPEVLADWLRGLRPSS